MESCPHQLRHKGNLSAFNAHLMAQNPLADLSFEAITCRLIWMDEEGLTRD